MSQEARASGRAAWSSVADVYQGVVHDVVRALDEAGMDSGVFSALAYLDQVAQRRLPMSELQRRLYPRYSQPGFSRLVQRMEADRLVVRRRDAGDRRAVVVAMTRLGRERFRKADAIYADALEHSFAMHLDLPDRARLVGILEKVTTSRAAGRQIEDERY